MQGGVAAAGRVDGGVQPDPAVRRNPVLFWRCLNDGDLPVVRMLPARGVGEPRPRCGARGIGHISSRDCALVPISWMPMPCQLSWLLTAWKWTARRQISVSPARRYQITSIAAPAW